MATCKDCGHEIEWAEGPGGKPMAFDVAPITFLGKPLRPLNGPWVIVNAKARRVTPQDIKLRRERRTCHFDTCKERKRK